MRALLVPEQGFESPTEGSKGRGLPSATELIWTNLAGNPCQLDSATSRVVSTSEGRPWDDSRCLDRPAADDSELKEEGPALGRTRARSEPHALLRGLKKEIRLASRDRRCPNPIRAIG